MQTFVQTRLIAHHHGVYLSDMSKSRKKSSPVTTHANPVIPTQTTINWSSLEVGVVYEFRHNIDFESFVVMRNRAHNAAKRLGLKAITSRESGRGVLKVQFSVSSEN
jgi:hypothetical protein